MFEIAFEEEVEVVATFLSYLTAVLIKFNIINERNDCCYSLNVFSVIYVKHLIRIPIE